MKTRYLLSAIAVTLVAGAASAQYVPNAYNEPYCREFTKVVNVGGRPQEAYGQACMQPDGSWQIVSDNIPETQPVQYYPAQNYVAYEPVAVPSTTTFSLNFGSWSSPYRTRYYNDHGHGWRDWNRGGRGDWNRGRDNDHGRGRGGNEHGPRGNGGGNWHH